MNCDTLVEQIKSSPGFSDNVGMILVHNGVVRSWSRNTKTVSSVYIKPDLNKIKEICNRFEQNPGIFKVLAHANEGTFKPGDDLLFLAVAGDIRENVISTLTNLLNTIKSEAVFKEEHF